MIRPTAVRLNSADGRLLEVKGECAVQLCSKILRRKYLWTFVVANTSVPIIGADFLSHFELLVDCSKAELTDGKTNLSVACITEDSKDDLVQSVPVLSIPENFPLVISNLLKKFKSLLSPIQIDYNSYRNKTNPTFHYIETVSDKPVFARVRQLTPEKLEIAKKEFEQMLSAGIIRPSNSAWATPLHMVPKPGENKWRPCGDYRKLNSITKHDKYPVPNVKSLSGLLYGKKIFSKLDLVKAFYHIPVAKDDIEKTAIITPFGLYEFLCMPFGLRNAAQSFQRYMHSVLRNLNFVFVYIDDILIFSENEEEHQKHLEMVFQRLADNQLHLSVEKCVFCVSEIDFLGFNISSEGILPKESKVDAINEYQKPLDYSGLRRFLGMVNFYRRFIPQFASRTEHLYSLLGSTNQRNHPLSWNVGAEAEFVDIKQSLKDATLLCHNFPSRVFHLVTDASSVAIGAALHQVHNGVSKPVGFFSKRLSSTQRSYSAFDRELLAVYLSVLHFKYVVEGQEVHVFTDHKPLVAAFYSPNPSKSDRQQRHLSLISEYISTIEHINGGDNVVADALSRSVNAVEIDFPDLNNISELQKSDDEISEYKDRLVSHELSCGKIILCDMDNVFPRPFVPKSCREKIFNHLHCLSHPGVNGSIKLIAARYFWPLMRRDIKTWVQNCLPCQQSKIQIHCKSPIQQPIFPYTDRFQTVHMDIIGPFTPSHSLGSLYTSNLKYVVTFIDRATRWFECVPVPDITAETVASAFLSGWIARFGVPLHLVTDQGRQFEGDLFKQLSSVVGFHRLRTTSYHPQSNGMIERFHRTLKTALKARNEEWLIALPVVQLALRCIPNETSFSPITALTGTTLLTPHMYFKSTVPSTKQQVEFIKTLSSQMSQLDFRQLAEGIHHGSSTLTKSRIPNIQTGDFVWVRIDRVRRPLEAPYQGPFEVLESNSKLVKVKYNNDHFNTVSIDRIKPVTLPIFKSNNAPNSKFENSKLNFKKIQSEQSKIQDDKDDRGDEEDVIQKNTPHKYNLRVRFNDKNQVKIIPPRSSNIIRLQ